MNNNCLSIILFLLLILSQEAAAVNEVSPFCTKATTQPDDKAICTRFVKGATTWSNAMTNAINAVIKISIEAKPLVNGLGKMLPPGRETLVQICQDALYDQEYYLRKCIDLVKNDPTTQLPVYLGNVWFNQCKNAFDDDEIHNADVDGFYHRLLKLTNILLAIYETKP